MYRVYFINFGYYADKSFDTAEDALYYGKGGGFEFVVYGPAGMSYSWSPIGGTKTMVPS